MKYPVSPIIFKEQWLPITNDIVNNILPYYFISTYGRIYSSYSNKILKNIVDKDGYEVICLHLKSPNGKSKYTQITLRVNRLVLIRFNPIQGYEFLEANHKDSNRRNNNILNLEWVTPKENTYHRIIYGAGIRNINGENNPEAKLSEQQVLEIISLIKSQKYSLSDIAKMYSISASVISSIAHNRSWNCLGNQINKSDLRVSSGFTNEEIHNICTFFSNHDINNKSLYSSKNSILKDCYFKLHLNEKYGDFENKRKTLSRILDKSRSSHDNITKQYNYNYID